MTDWERIINHFNATARCKRRREGKPQVSYEPGCLTISCDHEKCVCAMNFHGDEPLSTSLIKWQERHG